MLSALAFLTVVGRSGRGPDRATLAWLAPVGAAIGAVVAAARWGAGEVWAPGIAAALAVTADLVVTGALHLDGVADSADGLLPPVPAERRLAIMRTPDVGAFGVVAVVVVLLLRWTALATPSVPALGVVGLWSAARGLAAAVPAFVPYARADGLASAFLGGATRWLALAPVPGAVLLAVADGGRGALAGAVAVVASAGVVAGARRRIGGFTGDVLGAAIVVAETAGLLVLAVER